ncbi:DNA-binding transcriptional regulator LsrR (DeoR family) [Anaerosolibacter carboniphilus]|uniref:DNA-binding transcriptional regulator LsrR (DeoR family) n=1 Tax=Anaerosolibacter carboniphilus TaxID=1417629 RepID=A0A841KUS7_9FIRM|nr:sugar-binding transcriptional regulator [Anaerosolibacter carboniphilus]MBB6217406.1 DNA-binding transcriptional regulator LsrR (DeoR family) [Anaerosolibacter carboniphilus]
MRKVIHDIRLMTKCCMLYYEEHFSQQQISDILGLSRPTVSRILKHAKDTGIVEIKIVQNSQGNYEDLERQLEKKFGLKEVIIVDDKTNSQGQKAELGKAAAKYLERTLKHQDIVGVSMGTTIKEISNFIEQNDRLNVTFIPLIGGVGQVWIDIHPNQIVRDLAQVFGGEVRLLHAPAVLSNESIKSNLKMDKSIQQIMKDMNAIELAVVGIGVPTDKRSTMMATGYFQEEDIRIFEKKKAVGDICLQFYDINGNTDQFDFNRNVFGIEIERLRKINKVLGVAGGCEKAEAIIGAIQGKYINILVTNYSCGRKLLER